MKISLIMSACNQSHYLGETVESAINDGFAGNTDWEIVIVDDRSTDGCCDAIRHDKIKIVRPSTKLGCSRGRYHAAANATGDVLIITDPHCYYPRGALVRIATAAADMPTIVEPSVNMEGKSVIQGGVFIIRREGIAMGRPSGKPQYPTLYGSIYAVSRKTYMRMACLPVLPGIWGKWEQYMTTIAYRLGIGVHVVSDVVCTHRRYRVPKTFPYPMDKLEPIRNSFWYHAGCLPETYKSVWESMLVRFLGPDPAYRSDLKTNEFHRFRNWLARKSVWSEYEFLEKVVQCRDVRRHPKVMQALGV